QIDSCCGSASDWSFGFWAVWSSRVQNSDFCQTAGRCQELLMRAPCCRGWTSSDARNAGGKSHGSSIPYAFPWPAGKAAPRRTPAKAAGSHGKSGLFRRGGLSSTMKILIIDHDDHRSHSFGQGLAAEGFAVVSPDIICE